MPFANESAQFFQDFRATHGAGYECGGNLKPLSILKIWSRSQNLVSLSLPSFLSACLQSCLAQGWPKKRAPGLMNFVPAVAYHSGLSLPEKFSHPGDHFYPSSVRSVRQGDITIYK